MEIKGKTADSIAIFWTTLNEMLTEVSGQETVFSPWMFITDEGRSQSQWDPKSIWPSRCKEIQNLPISFQTILTKDATEIPSYPE